MFQDQPFHNSRDSTFRMVYLTLWDRLHFAESVAARGRQDFTRTFHTCA